MPDDQLREDIRILIGEVRGCREDVAAARAEILGKLNSFGTTVGGDMGGVLQRLEAVEHAVEILKQPAGRPRAARVR